MKCIVLISALIALALAEPPRPTFARFNSAKQQDASGPYPGSGWRPSGPQFKLPARQEQTPSLPPQTYLPSASYGPPSYEPPTTVKNDPEELTTPVPTTTEFSTEQEQLKEEPKKSENLQEEKGVYYIYHPNGFLQKVVFTTSNDVTNMAYTAQLKYEDVEPIKDPVYTYDPETLTYKQIL